jgi:6-pyruvoyl-tetrahydropterin synthase
MYYYIIVGILIVLIIIIVVYVAYTVSAAYQQTLSVTIPFVDTYRSTLNNKNTMKLDTIKITVSGNIKNDFIRPGVITLGDEIKEIIEEHIINHYKGCLLIHEADTFNVEENVLKRCPMIKNPTLENLTILFFNKLGPIMPNIGCQLVSISLLGGGMKVKHSRYKMSDYKI